jgi:hypothetical protein
MEIIHNQTVKELANKIDWRQFFGFHKDESGY